MARSCQEEADGRRSVAEVSAVSDVLLRHAACRGLERYIYGSLCSRARACSACRAFSARVRGPEDGHEAMVTRLWSRGCVRLAGGVLCNGAQRGCGRGGWGEGLWGVSTRAEATHGRSASHVRCIARRMRYFQQRRKAASASGLSAFRLREWPACADGK